MHAELHVIGVHLYHGASLFNFTSHSLKNSTLLPEAGTPKDTIYHRVKFLLNIIF
jgi:hypothetical protein